MLPVLNEVRPTIHKALGHTHPHTYTEGGGKQNNNLKKLNLKLIQTIF